MCNYKNPYPKIRPEHAGCSMPAFYDSYELFFAQSGLPIDKDGLCIFHSQDTEWKISNNLSYLFQELIDCMASIVETEKEKLVLDQLFKFAGFNLPTPEIETTFVNIVANLSIDLSYCHFEGMVSFNNCRLGGLNTRSAHFDNRLKLSGTEIKGESTFTKAIFQKGLLIENCALGGYPFFDRCVFNNDSDVQSMALQVVKTRFRDPVDFSDSSFQTNVAFRDVVFESDLSFDRCYFQDEVYFHVLKLNGSTSFVHAEFYFNSNANPIYSCISFVGLEISTDGKLNFQGTRPLHEMVRGELQLELAGDLAGRISFENFDLNKLKPSSKMEILKLQTLGKVDVGRGCLKYRYQSDIKNIESNEANIPLFEELARTFANYYSVHNGFMLGVELVERTSTTIRFFYFSDENISSEVFHSRFEITNEDFWNPSNAKGTNKIESVTQGNYQRVDSAIGLFQICLKIFYRFPSKDWKFEDLLQIAFTTSYDNTPVIAPESIESGVKGIVKLVIQNLHVSGEANIRKLNIKSSQVVMGNNTGTMNFRSKLGLDEKGLMKIVKMFNERSDSFQESIKSEVKSASAMPPGADRDRKVSGIVMKVVQDGLPYEDDFTIEEALEYLQFLVDNSKI